MPVVFTFHKKVRDMMGLLPKSPLSFEVIGDILVLRKSDNGKQFSITSLFAVPSTVVKEMAPSKHETFRIVGYNEFEIYVALVHSRTGLLTREGAAKYIPSPAKLTPFDIEPALIHIPLIRNFN